MKLSKNFFLAEFLKSNVATRRGIDNSPEFHHIEQIKLLCEFTLQPIRDGIGRLGINSGFRSEELNKALGGAHKIKDGVYIPTSQHCKGQAADLKYRNNKGKVDNKVIWDYVLENNIPFDQMINEFDYAWIHISYNPKGNRCQLLEAYKGSNGKTKYKMI
jgi:zinc D-Ala-D-Ala carboxypeptidase